MAADISAVAETRVAGRWLRHIPANGDPLFRPEHPGDGRWQRGVDVEGFYLADGVDTMWAEWYRLLAELRERTEAMLPRDVWQFAVDVDGVADLSTADALAQVDLTVPAPSRASWPAYQDVGAALAHAGFAGVIAPAASRPQGRVLCVFRRSDQLPGVTPAGPPFTQVTAPIPPQGMTT